MKAIITRPERCPHYKLGVRYAICLYPANKAPLRCDTAVSAVGADGFPLDCPLRREGEE